MKISALLVFGVSLVLSGCVKLQIDPGDVVSDSVDAGKDLYYTIKRKRSGEEERTYTQYVASAQESDDTLTNVRCKEKIQDNIEASSLKLTKILAESTEIVELDGVRKVKCEMVTLLVQK